VYIKKIFLSILILGFTPLIFTQISCAEHKSSDEDKNFESKMSNSRLDMLIKRVDKNAKGKPGYWTFTVANQKILVITDEKADRMRIISPVVKSDKLSQGELHRLMQANFDSALDARYAIAKGILWSAFIHPLSSLTDEDFLVSLGQVTNLVTNYGRSFSSGALIYRGGDSEGLQKRELIDDLLERGLAV